MKHQKIRVLPSDTLVARLTDAEIEARVFEDLEAQRARDAAKHADATVVLQYPDDRTGLQRLRAWWSGRARPVKQDAISAEGEVAPEPNWQGHWALTKYL